ncbi:MAG: hypothetical protein K8L91_00210, partial [Anaerolineae bacterium]|nr:hypothetical protein [Anaerolineae bacterium]
LVFFMLRVLQAAVVLMGGLLLMMTSMVGQARENQAPPYEMMLRQSWQNHSAVNWLLFNPYTGRIRPFMEGVVGVEFLGWADDGVFIYTAVDGDNYALFRAESADGPSTLLADRLALPDGIWSPDRRWIVVQQIGLRGDSILAVRTDGSGSAVLKTGLNVGRQVAVPDYAFSPDGLSIAMTVREGRNPAVYVARLDGTAITNVTPPDTRLVAVEGWLPIAEGLIVQADAKLVWVDVETGASRRVTGDKGYPSETINQWTQLPNGQVWVGIMEAESSGSPLHLVNAADGTPILDEPNVRWALYSPDAAYIMLISDDGTWAILEVATQQRRVLELPFGGVNTQQPVWSPDSRYVVAVSHVSGLLPQYAVWRLDVQTAGKFVALWQTPDSLFDPFWSPSGDHVLVASNAQLQTGLIWMKADGSDRQRLTHVQQLGQHDFSAWSPAIEKDWSEHHTLWGMGVGLLACAMVGQATRRRRHQSM